MPCVDVSKICVVGGPVTLAVVCVEQRLNKIIPICLLGGEALVEEDDNRILRSFYLSASFFVACSRRHVFCTERGTQKAKTFADKLCTVASKKARSYRTTCVSSVLYDRAVIVVLALGTARVKFDCLSMMTTKC